MRKLLIGLWLLLGGVATLRAQELRIPEAVADMNAESGNVVLFEDSSAAGVNLLSAPADSNKTWSFSQPAPDASPAQPAALPDPPAAKPTFVFGDRDDYRWQLALGVEYLRFRSNLFSASMVGTNTSLTYYTNDWFGIEGNVVTGFAPTIYNNDNVKYFGASGGARIGTRRSSWEPWLHGLFGFGHVQPQTAGYSRNSLAITAGGGVDWRIHPRFAVRGEVDYVYSRFFSSTQNNFQASLGAVLYF